ncbi:unnamed protein product [Trifolium pratense]|uniref:Uncharacterized protein n=1 Tax=Trifolium pratense TaxID=57577 RepID=A0ACB0KX66_TRIPR|nr:unnamed protein product [Trifolium pratense]
MTIEPLVYGPQVASYKDEVWKSATATYIKDKDSSLIRADYGGWCNSPYEHFEMSEAAFAEIAKRKSDIVLVQYRRYKKYCFNVTN